MFDGVFHMIKCINKTCEQNKKCSSDKTGEGKVVSDLAVSAEKYHKIVMQEKKIHVQTSPVVYKMVAFFYCVLTAFFHMFKCINKTSEQNKKCSLDKTGEWNVVLDLTISA